MMDYKSPIEITIGQFRWEQEKRIEGEVFSAIQEVGINVDREELVKALQYDRDQYRKGYEDGVRANADTVEEFAKRRTVLSKQSECSSLRTPSRITVAECSSSKRSCHEVTEELVRGTLITYNLT